MRLLLSLALCLGALSGCASFPEGPTLEIEPPLVTPFDSNPAQRAAYLDAYHQGYWSAAREGRISDDFIRGPHQFARELGWRAGASQALANSDEPGK